MASCRSAPVLPGTWTARPRCVPLPNAGPGEFSLSECGNGAVACGIVIPFVQAQVLGCFLSKRRTFRRGFGAGHDYTLQSPLQQLRVVDVGSSHHHAQGSAFRVDQDALLAPRFTPPKRVEGRTFEFSFPLPPSKQPKRTQSADISKNSSPKQRVAGQQKGRKSDGPAEKATPKSAKAENHAQLKTVNRTNEAAPSKGNIKLQDRRAYNRMRSQLPERKESHRLYQKKRREKAKERGQCRSCSNPSIPGQIRCVSCAEHHRESHRRYDAKRKAMADPALTTEK